MRLQVEEHKFRELREGTRRVASSRQASTLAEATRCEDTRAKAAAVRSNVAKQVCGGIYGCARVCQLARSTFMRDALQQVIEQHPGFGGIKIECLVQCLSFTLSMVPCVLTHPTQAAREKADFFKSYEERLASLTQQSSLEHMDSTRRAQQRTNKIREREMALREANSKNAYQPFTGSKTTLQARLAALAQNLQTDKRTRSAEG